jgi:hypothetical protein
MTAACDFVATLSRAGKHRQEINNWCSTAQCGQEQEYVIQPNDSLTKAVKHETITKIAKRIAKIIEAATAAV